MTSGRGNAFVIPSSQQGIFELTRHPSRSLDSPRALLPDKDTVRCAALGAEVPGHSQQQLTQTC